MGIAAIAYSKTGQTVILGTAAVPTRRVQLVEVRTVVKVFLEKLRAHRGCQLSTLVPIVEWYVPVSLERTSKINTLTRHSNNNEVFSHEMVTVFDGFPPVNKPWNKARWAKNVADGIGVYSA